MPRRLSERILLKLPAKIILAGKSYDATVVNISEDGIGSAITSVVETHAEFIPANSVELHFEDPSGRAIDLVCELAWFSRNEVDSRKIAIGMSIINPSPAYKMFIKALYDDSLMNKSKEQLIAELLEARRIIADLKKNAASE